MELSISLPDSQVELLDRIIANRGISSRSAAIQQGVELFLHEVTVSQYRLAFLEWAESGEAEVWNCVVGDGLDDSESPW
jgi:Arc/MetJ-type ribon-helix-helix transcriptional regulator